MLIVPYESSWLKQTFRPLHNRSLHVIVLVALIAAVDILTEYVNFPLLYTIPAMLYIRSGTARQRWRLAGAAVILVPLGLLLTVSGPVVTGPHEIEGYRLFNRAMALILVLAITAAGSFLQAMRERLPGRADDPSDPDQLQNDHMIEAVEQFAVSAVSAACALVIFVLDVVAPSEFNTSILYGLPLLLLITARSKGILWTALPVLVILVWGGFAIGQHTGPNWLTVFLQLNRALTSVALCAIAVIGHAWLRYSKKTRER